MTKVSSAYGTSGARYSETITPEDAKKFHDYMEQMQKLWQDFKDGKEVRSSKLFDLQLLMRKINDIPGLENTGRGDDRDLVFLFLKAAGIDVYSDKFDYSKLEALKSAAIEIPPGSGKKITLDDAFELALDPKRLKVSTQILADVLLDVSRTIYTEYEKTLNKLMDQVEHAGQVIKDLKELLDILKQYKVKFPDGFESNPSKWTKWEDIPKGLRDIFHDKLTTINWKQEPDGSWAPKYTKDFDDLKAWANDKGSSGQSKYVEMAEAYFKTKLGVEPNPTAIKNLLAMRDDLRTRLNALLKEASKSLDSNLDPNKVGSATYTLKKVVEDLEKRFPPPADPSKPKPGEFPNDGRDWSKDSTFMDKAKEFIMNGQGYEKVTGGGWKELSGEKKIFDLINDAVSANQFLSQELSDKIKAKNVFLQTLYDEITKAMQTLHQIVQTMARNLAR